MSEPHKLDYEVPPQKEKFNNFLLLAGGGVLLSFLSLMCSLLSDTRDELTYASIYVLGAIAYFTTIFLRGSFGQRVSALLLALPAIALALNCADWAGKIFCRGKSAGVGKTMVIPHNGGQMDSVAITVGLSWTLTGLLLIGLAIPLIRQRVGRNGWYGVRFPESYKSDEAWFAINHYGGKRLLIWALPVVLVGIVCFFLPLQPHPGLALTVGFAPLVFILAPAIEAWRFARHYR